ncbi:hypothetical protein ACO0LB_06840 [Undibacterium sp. SXout7W]|uniref:hypothetical protein n=1 Tax=Undibacterium sp. SXout7W TaxID=3413049 RepID=UPI003BF033F8
MQNSKLIKLRAQALINSALRSLKEEGYEEAPEKTVDYESYGTLTPCQIDQGVVALVLHCNLSGGSMADMDLYNLVKTYLRNTDARASMNAIIANARLTNKPITPKVP